MKRDVTAMADDLRADLDQLLAEGSGYRWILVEKCPLVGRAHWRPWV